MAAELMTDFDAWRTRSNPSVTAARAAAAWERIQDNASTITLYRGSTAQTAQTMRLVWTQGRPEVIPGSAQMAVVTRLVLFGVRDHPDDSIADTAIQHGDRFTLDGVNYQVVDVATYPGEVQAWAERIR